jgi:hypothetical protein
VLKPQGSEARLVAEKAIGRKAQILNVLALAGLHY